MATYTLPHFGPIDTESLVDYYDTDIIFNNAKVNFDLHFDEESIDISMLEKVQNVIEELSEIDIELKKHIERDFTDENGDTVSFYIQKHLEGLNNDTLATLIDIHNKETDPALQLLKKLRLVRVGFYPHSDEHFAIIDYSIGKDITDYLVVLSLDANLNFAGIFMES